MTADQARDLIDLLCKTRSLGRTFDCGTAYISRIYIDEQTALRARITAAIDLLETVGVVTDPRPSISNTADPA
jgi:hypothetical protein